MEEDGWDLGYRHGKLKKQEYLLKKREEVEQRMRKPSAYSGNVARASSATRATPSTNCIDKITFHFFSINMHSLLSNTFTFHNITFCVQRELPQNAIFSTHLMDDLYFD
ncbi:hypothetical protein AB6A40_004041 [Gnathostoma spinigerum]|uniref:Uncharacterized protein n=1 Tax=Gnathostoma spinigerum TaxID=75299 RepID=A0ABD6EL81_9BILA